MLEIDEHDEKERKSKDEKQPWGIFSRIEDRYEEILLEEMILHLFMILKRIVSPMSSGIPLGVVSLTSIRFADQSVRTQTK